VVPIVPTKHIIALGGGGFSMEPDNLALDRYILEQAATANPTVCFVPTASGDADNYIMRFYAAFATLPCRPRHLPLFRQPRDLAAIVAQCDVIYVGGGNTRNMLAIWRASGFDLLVQQAWERGVVLCGVSAGAICWFEQGLTDSWGGLDPMNCLGFVRGSCCPHYDGEPGRRSAYLNLIQNGALAAGYALDDGAAAHFIDDRLAHVVTSRPAARAFHVRGAENGIAAEDPLPTRFLPPAT
jgi:peptidase E